MSSEWRAWVRREVYRHGAAWTPIYLAGDDVLRCNHGAYQHGTIWLNKRLEGRSDVKTIEIIHHEIFHLKIERARALNAKLGRMRMNEATTMASEVAEAIFHLEPRSALIRHYANTAGPDFGEECLVQMCCALMFSEPINLPPRLRVVCKALLAPYSRRFRFLGGFIATLPDCRHGVQDWPDGKLLPGQGLPKAPNLSSEY
jgi:hypothetical protein